MSKFIRKDRISSYSDISSIVFVHGLTGHREKTWTAPDATESWPKTLIPTKIPNARVLTFGYDASVADWRSMVSESRVGNHAQNLLNALANFREDDDTNERPIIFVCHSLGGLVCEDVCLSFEIEFTLNLADPLPGPRFFPATSRETSEGNLGGDQRGNLPWNPSPWIWSCNLGRKVFHVYWGVKANQHRHTPGPAQ